MVRVARRTPPGSTPPRRSPGTWPGGTSSAPSVPTGRYPVPGTRSTRWYAPASRSSSRSDPSRLVGEGMVCTYPTSPCLIAVLRRFPARAEEPKGDAMGMSLSRRRVVTWGAAGAVGAALPLVHPGGAAAAPDSDAARGGPGRIFDVTRFGARGDGTTIDSDAINRAIAAAAAAGRDGGPRGTVYFPAGTDASYSIRLQSHLAPYPA